MHAVSLGHLDSSPFWLGLEPGRKLQLPPRLDFVVTIIMAKSIRVTTKKRRGRPPTTGKGVQVGERWHPSELAAIDAWIASSPDKNITRAHAIRRLVALGLRARRPRSPSASPAGDCALRSSPQRPSKRLSIQPHRRKNEPSAGVGKGPPEFREDRVDQPKVKTK
jgi:hypothetical protein